MKVLVRNPLWANREAYRFALNEFEAYHGEEITVKWVGSDSLALTTGDNEFPFRVIPRAWITAIDDQPYEYRARESTKTVQGSSGEEYVVTLGARPTCTCKGFQFRRTCRHIL
jgi:hypothetical protein